jgi:hypothetical protein
MIRLDAARLPIVLVVDPVVASRHHDVALAQPVFRCPRSPRRAMPARLACRRNIDALVVQSELPDTYGSEFVESLAAAQVAVASRAIRVVRSVDLRTVVTNLAGWFFSRDDRKADVLLREADRLVS